MSEESEARGFETLETMGERRMSFLLIRSGFFSAKAVQMIEPILWPTRIGWLISLTER